MPDPIDYRRHYTAWDCYSHACGGQRVTIVAPSYAGEERDEHANQRIVWSGFAKNMEEAVRKAEA